MRRWVPRRVLVSIKGADGAVFRIIPKVIGHTSTQYTFLSPTQTERERCRSQSAGIGPSSQDKQATPNFFFLRLPTPTSPRFLSPSSHHHHASRPPAQQQRQRQYLRPSLGRLLVISQQGSRSRWCPPCTTTQAEKTAGPHMLHHATNGRRALLDRLAG